MYLSWFQSRQPFCRFITRTETMTDDYTASSSFYNKNRTKWQITLDCRQMRMRRVCQRPVDSLFIWHNPLSSYRVFESGAFRSKWSQRTRLSHARNHGSLAPVSPGLPACSSGTVVIAKRVPPCLAKQIFHCLFFPPWINIIHWNSENIVYGG